MSIRSKPVRIRSQPWNHRLAKRDRSETSVLKAIDVLKEIDRSVLKVVIDPSGRRKAIVRNVRVERSDRTKAAKAVNANAVGVAEEKVEAVAAAKVARVAAAVKVRRKADHFCSMYEGKRPVLR